MNEPAQAAAPRYAVYFAPAQGSQWWRFGQAWLHGDAGPPSIEPGAWQAMRREPQRYGFHATLKAPFVLAAPASEADLHARLAQLAARLRAVPLGAVQALAFKGFVALAPLAQTPALQALAAACTTELDELRAPLQAADLARRQPHRLDERGRELLQRWGYPHVLERFRWHMTLAMCDAPADTQAVIGAAQAQLVPLQQQEPLVLDRLCLFVEPSRGAAFVRQRDFVLQP